MALITPFAENGNRATIPATTSDGSVSYDQGFGSFYALPPEEGGLFIDRAQFNQLMYDTTSQVLTNKSNIATIQSDVSSINNTISQVISSDVTPIGVYKNVKNRTIGANGDFKTIQEAFTYVQTHQKQNIWQELNLTLLENLSGDLEFRGAWYPYLSINCNGFVLGNKVSFYSSSFLVRDLKTNDRVYITSSIMIFSGNNTEINYQSNEWMPACITLYSGLVSIGGTTCKLSTTSNKSGFYSSGNSMLHISRPLVITQTTGANCFSVGDGGIIQIRGGLNLNGVTVRKANQVANTITNNGLIIGNYYTI